MKKMMSYIFFLISKGSLIFFTAVGRMNFSMTKIAYVLEVEMGIKNLGPCVIFVWNKLEYMDIHIHLH